MNLQLLLTFFALAKIATVSGAVTGSLAVTEANKQVQITGKLEGLPRKVTNGGIHVHSGKDCTNGGATDASAVNAHVGGHLFSNYIDGWAYPAAITYDTDSDGAAKIVVKAKHYALSKEKGTEAVPSVEGRCIVLHGLSASDMASRVAIGKIVKSGDSYSATIGRYPGPNALTTKPAGKLTITIGDGDVVQLSGVVTGLGKNLKNAGIHVHTGTDCTGGSDVKTKDAVNKVVGGHLYSKGDGYLTTTYSSDAEGYGKIDIKTPLGSYALRSKDGTNKAPSVENHCIVIHDATGARVGIGQILCSKDSCAAKMGAYPEPAAATTTKKPTVVVTKPKPVTKGKTTKAHGGEKKSELKEMEVKYSDGRGGELVGYCIAEETTSKAKRPGLLVFPGPYGDGGGEEEREVAREYARKGMVVFLPDYYPTRNSDTNFDQTLAAIAAYDGFLKDSDRAQEIAKLGYDQLAKSDMVDPDKISAIGFCFGGAMTLNLARSGAKLVVAVSLHGEYPHLDTHNGTTSGAIGEYNTQHFVEMVGHNDPFIPEEARDAWVDELKGRVAKTDKTFDFIVYGTSVHAFSIHYSKTFLDVLAFVLSEYKGLKGAKRVGEGIPGVIRYDPDVSETSFNTINKLLVQYKMLSPPSKKGDGGEKKSELKEMEVKYSDGRGGELVGYCIAEETTSKAKRPGLLVFPGPYGDGGGEEEREVAREYARKGMVVFLPDYYPTRNSDTDFNQTLMAIAQYDDFLKDSERAQEIAKFGYDQLAKSDMVDPDKISAIGFCFGGAMTLNLARSGAKLLAAVSLHGEYPHLETHNGTTSGAIGKYNTQHFVEMVGYADPFIPEAARDAWVDELKGYTAKTDKTFDFIVYGTSVHAFSIHYSKTFLNVLAFVLREFKGLKWAKVVGDGIPGVIRYDPDIAMRSFARINKLFAQVGMIPKRSGGGEPTKKPGPASALMIMGDNACIKLGVKSDVTICRVGPNELAISGDLKINGMSLMSFIEKADKFMDEYKN